MSITEFTSTNSNYFKRPSEIKMKEIKDRYRINKKTPESFVKCLCLASFVALGVRILSIHYNVKKIHKQNFMQFFSPKFIVKRFYSICGNFIKQ